MKGKVYIVGAGPGDPELLTVKATRLLKEADVVLYDRLVGDAILGMIPAGTARIYAGKSCKSHAMSQSEINTMLVQLAKLGKTVLRLKGGDPFIFGRGGEEAEALAEAGVSFEIVPGISAASGCSAYAGIPLTHRDYAQGVRYITGHLKEPELAYIDWQALATPQTTLIVYMGLVNAEIISRELVAHGRPKDTPCAAIENGTTQQQRVCTTTLEHLPRDLTRNSFVSPTLLVIGEVVKLANKLDWFKPQLFDAADKQARL
jgi:uroporphyrin-III C-methyltransferase / precorrin-2 dehydrogenase / sirohydrochlorin ferrochelatase